jgi:hypothetical protein
MFSRMNRGFLVLLFALCGVAFAAAWRLSTPDMPPPAIKTPNGKLVAVTNCDDARANGVAPLLAGQPGYTSKLDPDGDGIACPPG